jgi:mRNA-degrading endonuclease toxin of MazEF toxin-antitoxin module
MIQPKPGEVWWIDLGMKAKFRPMMIVSREDAKAERALSVCALHDGGTRRQLRSAAAACEVDAT